MGREVSGQFLFLFVIPLIVIFFSDRNKITTALCLALSFGGFITLELTNYYFFYSLSLSPSVNKFLSISVFLITSVILFFTLKLYRQLFRHVKDTLAKTKIIYQLTEREIEVITIALSGKSNKDIGLALYIEESTVKIHLKNIYKKINVKSRSELIAKYLSQ